MKTDLFGMFAPEIAEKIQAYGLQKYRGQQIAEWMYKKQVTDFAAMTNLSLRQRQLLNEHFAAGFVTLQTSQFSADNKTSKYLLALSDDLLVETVLMLQPYGASVCVSTQVGCAMGCVFCASNLTGMTRNLTTGEMLAQVLFANRALPADSPGLHSLVIMGSGEPLANYEQVVRFIRLLHEPYCLNLSYRHITLSTSGIVPAIERLAKENLPLTLSISLHAPNNELRSRLMPVNMTYPLEKVLAAGDYYGQQTGRRVTYEYTLIAGINDQLEHARQLSSRLKGRLANINLIPVNPVPERGLYRPSQKQIIAFNKELILQGMTVTVRREMGTDIDAACGQLRKRFLQRAAPSKNI